MRKRATKERDLNLQRKTRFRSRCPEVKRRAHPFPNKNIKLDQLSWFLLGVLYFKLVNKSVTW